MLARSQPIVWPHPAPRWGGRSLRECRAAGSAPRRLEREALLADELGVQELLKGLGGELLQQPAAVLLGELRPVAGGLHPLLQPLAPSGMPKYSTPRVPQYVSRRAAIRSRSGACPSPP
jgi:hypothetical protein